MKAMAKFQKTVGAFTVADSLITCFKNLKTTNNPIGQSNIVTPQIQLV
jgi:hypothetical protein